MDYTTFFTRMGKLAKSINSLEVIPLTTIPGIVTDVATAFALNRNPIPNFEATANQWQSATDSWRSQLTGYGSNYLSSAEVTAALGVTTGSPDDALTALISQMIVDAQSITPNVITIGSPGFSGVGNGKLMASSLLDGVSAPLAGALPRRAYANTLSQLAVPSETVRATCIADQYTDRLTPGQEQFRLSGAQLNVSPPLSYLPQGSGQGPTLSTVEAGTKILNGGFEQFTVANTPNNWTIVTGVAGTQIFQSTVTFFRDLGSLKLTGDGALATIELTQNVTLTPLGLIVVSAWLKADPSISTGTLTICFKGTGYTASSSEKIVIAPASLPTSWTHYNFFIVPPAVVPANMRLSIAWSGTPQSTRNLFIDSLAVAAPVYHGGNAYAVSAGNVDFTRADLFTAAITNNTAGKFAEFFRRAFNAQLPASGSPTISDSLAT